MKIVFDASCLIILIKGNQLESVLKLSGVNYLLGPIAYDECGEDKAKIYEYVSCGKIEMVDDQEIPSGMFFELLGQCNLGRGESEAIAYCQISKSHLACDDKRARQIAKEKINEERVTGTLGLLRKCVQENIISVDDAFASYLSMKEKGAFLPEIEKSFFDSI